MILKFDFRKKKRPLKLLSFVLLIASIVLLAVAQRENLIGFAKLLKANKVFAKFEIKWPKFQERREVDLGVRRDGLTGKELVLCGVLRIGEQRYVYLKSSDGEKFILREGEYCGKFSIERVSPDSVILVWNDGKREVLCW